MSQIRSGKSGFYAFLSLVRPHTGQNRGQRPIERTTLLSPNINHKASPTTQQKNPSTKNVRTENREPRPIERTTLLSPNINHKAFPTTQQKNPFAVLVRKGWIPRRDGILADACFFMAAIYRVPILLCGVMSVLLQWER